MKRIRNFTAFFDAWALRVKSDKTEFGKRYQYPHFRIGGNALICYDFYLCHYFPKGKHVVLKSGHSNRWLDYALKALPSDVIVIDVDRAIPSNCDWTTPTKACIESMHNSNLQSLMVGVIRFGRNVRNYIVDQHLADSPEYISYFERTVNQEIDLLERHIKKTEVYADMFNLKFDWMALPSIDGLRNLLASRVYCMTKTLNDHGPEVKGD